MTKLRLLCLITVIASALWAFACMYSNEGGGNAAQTTMTGSTSSSYSGYSVYAVQTNSPGKIVGQGTVAADGSFKLQLSLDVQANIQLALVGADSSTIMVTFKSDDDTSNTILVANGTATINLGTITISNGSAVAKVNNGLHLGKKADREDMLSAIRAKVKLGGTGCSIVSYRPSEGAFVGPGQKPKLWFSSAVDEATLNNAFTLMNGTNKISGSWKTSAQGTQAMFFPSANLLDGNYTLSVDTSAACNGTKLSTALNVKFTVKANAAVEEEDSDIKISVGGKPISAHDTQK